MKFRASGADRACRQWISPSIGVGYDTACFGDQECSGSDVPGAEVALPTSRRAGRLRPEMRRAPPKPEPAGADTFTRRLRWSSDRNRPCWPRPLNGIPVANTASSSRVRAATRKRLPFMNAPRPRSAQKRSAFAGLRVTAATIRPSRCNAILIAKWGMAWRKFVVPSNGSTIQVWVLSVPSIRPRSSPAARNDSRSGSRWRFVDRLFGPQVSGGDAVGHSTETPARPPRQSREPAPGRPAGRPRSSP